MRFERGFGGRHRTVALDDAVRAGTGHRKNLRAAHEQTRAHQILHPIDERVCHHIERHLDAFAIHGLVGIFGNKGLGASKRHRVQHHLNRTAAHLLEMFLNSGDDLGAVAVVGDILVEENRLASFRFDVGFDLQRAGQRCL